MLAHDGISVGARRDDGAGRPRELIAAARRDGARARTRTRAADAPTGRSPIPVGNPELPSRGSAAGVTALAVRDVLDEIAANAAELDAQPAFPRAAFAALRDAGALTPPPDARGGVGAGARRSPRPTARVGRIFEGHLNALRAAARSTGSTRRTTCSASGAPTRRRDEGEPAHIEDDALHGEKVFCSGAGGLDRALVIARGHARLRRPRTTHVEIDKRWYRAGGMRASESHRVRLPRRAGPRHAAAR